jgi:hypothetical protein
MHIDAPSCRVACRLRRLAGSDPIVACCYVAQRVGRAKEKNILFMTNSSFIIRPEIEEGIDFFGLVMKGF